VARCWRGDVLASHVPLGQQVLARGIVFIDLARAVAGRLIARILWPRAAGLGDAARRVSAALLARCC